MGDFKEAARSANLLQDEFVSVNPDAPKLDKLDVEVLLQEAKRSVYDDILSPVNMIQDDINVYTGDAIVEIRDRFGDNPMPPALKNSTLADKIRKIDYDAFTRGVLNIVKTNSGLILALCYGSILWETWSSLLHDPEFDFLKREQLRNGDQAVIDTASVEKDPNVGANSVVMGGSGMDQLLYGSLYPTANKIPIPTHLSDRELKAAVLKGNDKTVYQNLSPAARQIFKKIFHHAPARGVF